jgi:hypothetical protein
MEVRKRCHWMCI